MLQLLQVTFIVLLESHVLVVRWFEEAFSRTPFNRVTQLEVAHALLLHPLDPQTLQSLLVLDRQAVRVIKRGEGELDVEVIRTGQ